MQLLAISKSLAILALVATSPLVEARAVSSSFSEVEVRSAPLNPRIFHITASTSSDDTDISKRHPDLSSIMGTVLKRQRQRQNGTAPVTRPPKGGNRRKGDDDNDDNDTPAEEAAEDTREAAEDAANDAAERERQRLEDEREAAQDAAEDAAARDLITDPATGDEREAAEDTAEDAWERGDVVAPPAALPASAARVAKRWFA